MYCTAGECLWVPCSCLDISNLLFCYSEFCAGAGQLHVFCPQASELLDQLLTNGRVRRLMSSPLPTPPPLRHGPRRLTRSESDLRCFRADEFSALGSPGQPCHFLRHKGVLERSHSSSRASATSDDYVQAIGGKVRTFHGGRFTMLCAAWNEDKMGGCTYFCLNLFHQQNHRTHFDEIWYWCVNTKNFRIRFCFILVQYIELLEV